MVGFAVGIPNISSPAFYAPVVAVAVGEFVGVGVGVSVGVGETIAVGVPLSG
jgi:hypothetical protein